MWMHNSFNAIRSRTTDIFQQLGALEEYIGKEADWHSLSTSFFTKVSSISSFCNYRTTTILAFKKKRTFCSLLASFCCLIHQTLTGIWNHSLVQEHLIISSPLFILLYLSLQFFEGSNIKVYALSFEPWVTILDMFRGRTIKELATNAVLITIVAIFSRKIWKQRKDSLSTFFISSLQLQLSIITSLIFLNMWICFECTSGSSSRNHCQR